MLKERIENFKKISVKDKFIGINKNDENNFITKNILSTS